MDYKIQLRRLITQRTGIEVPESSPSLDTLVAEQVKISNDKHPEAYIRKLIAAESSSPDWTRIIDTVTNRLTHFFRDSNQLDVLSTLLKTQQRKVGYRPLQLWSAGCSTGEEAYTLAILCHKHGIRAEILGTDINEHAIAAAKAGVYASWTLRHVAPELMKASFNGLPDGSFRPNSEIVEMVTFAQHNLIKDRAPQPNDSVSGWDAILCRNVLIYYSKSKVIDVTRMMIASLAKTGVLLTGASESLLHLKIPVDVEIVRGRIVYRRQDPQREKTVESFEWPIVPIRPVMDVRNKKTIKNAQKKADQPNSFMQIQRVVVECIQDERHQEAIDYLKKVALNNQNDLIARLCLGHAHMLLHELECAEKWYNIVVQMDSLLPETFFFIGILERKKRRLEIAMKSLKKAVFLEPTFWAASYFLATTAQRLGRKRVWKREWKRTAELLDTRQGTLPLISHPAFHTRFIPNRDDVVRTLHTPIMIRRGY